MDCGSSELPASSSGGSNLYRYDDLDRYRVQGLPERAYYIPEFISESEEKMFMMRALEEPMTVGGYRWNHWGRMPVLPPSLQQELPGWLQPLSARVASAFGLSLQPDSVYMDECVAGQSALPHMYSPSFLPFVFILTTGSRYISVMRFWQNGAAEEAHRLFRMGELLLEPRSLLLLGGSICTDYSHSVDNYNVFELLSALCVYNADGYARAVDTLDRYQALKGSRYRLGVVVEELQSTASVDYKTALLAFVNCLVISAPRLPDRSRVRNELIGLGILPTLNNLRHEAANHPDLGVQLDVFEEQRESDEAQARGPGGINLNSHLDVFYAILKQVADTPQEIPFLSILQHLLRIDPKEAVSDIVWDTAETLVHRATLLESRQDAARLLRAPSLQAKMGCTCQARDPTSAGRKQSLQRALSPPPPPPPPAPVTAPPPNIPPVSALSPPRGPPPPPPPVPPPPSALHPPTPPEPVVDVKLPQQETPIPKAKMKTINWNKIPNNKVIGGNNIWSIVASSHKHSPTTELDWSEIEGLFCQQVQGTGSAGSSPRLGRSPICDASADKKPRKDSSEITLLDGKRSLNVNIFLKQFRSSNEDIIQLIREGSHDDIGAEKLRGLLKIIPEVDECEMLKAFSGDPTKLGNAERFLLQLIMLPNYKLRIESMLLKEEWASTAGYWESAINAMLVAGDDLMSSRAIQEVLYLTLIAGNFLNAGGYAGGAAGVKLSSLVKLPDIRANKPGVTLVHYVAMQAERKNKELVHFADDTRVLEEAAKASVEQIHNELNALAARVAQITKETQLPTTPQDIKDQILDFLKVAEQEVTALKKDMEEVESLRKQLADFFCEDPVSFKLEECFKIFATFCGKFRAAVADNERRRAHEQQAAARRRARENAANKTRNAGSVCSTPVSECESLMESLLLDIKQGLGRRSLRRPHDALPSPDVTPTGSLRRRSRSRASPGVDEDVLLEFLRHSSPPANDMRERNAWGSLDRSWARRAPIRARLEIPERERPASPRAPPSPAPAAAPSVDASANANGGAKPKEWRQKIESWLRANNQEEKRDAELRERARRLQANRRSLENDSESERSTTLDPLPETRCGEWRPAVLPDSDVVKAIEAVEDVQPQTKERVPWRKTEENEEMRRLRRQRSRANIDTQLLDSISEEARRRQPAPSPEVDADNIETPPVQRKAYNPPVEREPCRRFQQSLNNAENDMRHLTQEILGDGQFDRFSAARRTRRYKRSSDDDKSVELVPDTHVLRPVTLNLPDPVVELPDKEDRLKRWQDRLKSQSTEKTPTKDEQQQKTPQKSVHPYSRMRRQTSINQEDVQKAIRELKSPMETPTGVWSRSALRKGVATELKDEGFEETQSLNSESASQGASSGHAECESPPARPPTTPRRTVTRQPAPKPTPKRAGPATARVERSASLRSSRSSLNSAASVATVRRAPTKPPPRAPLRAATPAERSSSSGSSVAGARAAAAGRGRQGASPRGVGFMRPTQASKGRGATSPTHPPFRAALK